MYQDMAMLAAHAPAQVELGSSGDRQDRTGRTGSSATSLSLPPVDGFRRMLARRAMQLSAEHSPMLSTRLLQAQVQRRWAARGVGGRELWRLDWLESQERLAGSAQREDQPDRGLWQTNSDGTAAEGRPPGLGAASPAVQTALSPPTNPAAVGCAARWHGGTWARSIRPVSRQRANSGEQNAESKERAVSQSLALQRDCDEPLSVLLDDAGLRGSSAGLSRRHKARDTVPSSTISQIPSSKASIASLSDQATVLIR
ncbi:uncharacterized protein BDR25DRAFT_318542 [Lindgomyces ingoldianus]|uniref:Uncharacterized protein n=1 Tax=Lindgomyces ingoldianus TaxID=673940 RepID=A0ACB6QE76_9PLEO|nr:uncharacterized protein BDR25DRAFT_318542 [Lindgomyces ingoldianus]KAF2465289.1 hypothetical protein BDR25DRAFT_318542 [Lindgomyces ingoldianus]